MKIFILKEKDFEALLAAIDRNPKYGQSGGSSVVLSKEEEKAHDEAHRFYNYHVRTWINKVKSE